MSGKFWCMLWFVCVCALFVCVCVFVCVCMWAWVCLCMSARECVCAGKAQTDINCMVEGQQGAEVLTHLMAEVLLPTGLTGRGLITGKSAWLLTRAPFWITPRGTEERKRERESSGRENLNTQVHATVVTCNTQIRQEAHTGSFSKTRSDLDTTREQLDEHSLTVWGGQQGNIDEQGKVKLSGKAS